MLSSYRNMKIKKCPSKLRSRFKKLVIIFTNRFLKSIYKVAIAPYIQGFSYIVRLSTFTAKKAIFSSSSSFSFKPSNKHSSSQGSSICTHLFRYWRSVWRSFVSAEFKDAFSIKSISRVLDFSPYSDRR